MLENLLATCGLNESERACLTCILAQGPSLASLIAKKTGLKRPTAYAALENLRQIGLITRQKRDGVNYFAAISAEVIPKVLENYARHRYEEIARASELLRAPLQELAGSSAKDFGGYMISSVDSTEAVYAQLEAVLLGGNFCAFFNPQVTILNEEMKRLVKRFLSITAKEKPHIREILVSGQLTDWYVSLIENPNHRLKFLPAGTRIFSDIILINGSALLCHYVKGGEVGIRIEQGDFYTSMMTVFEELWARI